MVVHGYGTETNRRRQTPPARMPHMARRARSLQQYTPRMESVAPSWRLTTCWMDGTYLDE